MAGKEKNNKSKAFPSRTNFNLTAINLLSNIIKLLPGGVYWKDNEGKYLGCNDYFLELTGRPTIVGKTDFDMPWSFLAQEILNNDLQIMASNVSCEQEETLIDKDGEEIFLLIKKTPLCNEDGRVVGLLGSVLDITERPTLVNETVQITLKNIVANMPGHVYWKDKSGVYLGCNDRQAKSLGFSYGKEIIGKTDFDLPWGYDVAEVFRENDCRIMARGQTEVIEEVAQVDGSRAIVLSHKSPMRNQEGEIIGVLGISIDITDRKKMESELEVAKESAETANQAKTEFIANMSHDIRTPLSGIIGLSEILEKNIEDPIQKENAHMLHNSGGELLGMLNDILDDVQAGNVSENKTLHKAFDLYQCVHDLVKLEKPTTELKHLGLHVQIDPNVPQYIISDRKKIHRILLNLLGNAIKFTQSGHITIKISHLRQRESSTQLEFSVIDTGIGIPKKLQSKVFERFFKVNPSYKGLYAGHGLGLHIVQLYVTLLGGHIRLSSEEGLGTTFCFDISCKLPDAAAIKSLARPANKLTAPNSVTVDKSKKPYLLLIEDNAIALRVLESMMMAEAYPFKSAENAEQAFELFQAETFDLIITDIGLPGLSGNELAQRIRVWEKSLKKKAIPIIGLTGHAKEKAQTECLAAGMNDVLTKPANRAVLISSINKFLDQNSSLEKQSIINGVGNLGYDLPSTEEQLFQLDIFPLFDPRIPLKEIDLPLLLTMLHDFISDKTQQDIQQMKQAYTNKDWVGIEKLAHKIKSGAAYLGIPRMQYACQYLERYYKAGHHLLLDKLYFQLIDVNAATINVLTAWLQEHDL